MDFIIFFYLMINNNKNKIINQIYYFYLYVHYYSYNIRLFLNWFIIFGLILIEVSEITDAR